MDINGTVKRKCLYGNDEMSQVIQEYNGTTMTEYDKNGKRKYVGGYRGDMNNGFIRDGNGTEYDGESRMAVYTGQWKNGRREGKGTEYKHGRSVYSGKWKEGMHLFHYVILSIFVLFFIVALVTVAVVLAVRMYQTISISDCSEFSNPSSFRSKQARRLRFKKGCNCRRIEIGDGAFQKVREFKLDGLNELESVVIGKKSFTIVNMGNDENYWKRTDGSYRIVNCLKHKSIQTGGRSFADYHSFELSNLPSLQTISFSIYCFHHTPSFSLTGLTD